MSGENIAALDLGSNTFRLMLAKKSNGFWSEKHVFQHIPRLAEHLSGGGQFATAALSRAWEALDDFAARIEKHGGASRVLACATMAARLASDGSDFIKKVERRYSWEAHIITGAEEANLTTAGVLSQLEPLPRHSLIFDIGGRSTEFVSVAGRSLVKSRSLDLGVVGLTESFLPHKTASGEEMKTAAAFVANVLSEADFNDVEPHSTLVGTAGTVTTVAAMLLGLTDYKPELVNNARINRESIETLLLQIAPMPVEERIAQYNLHPRRADAIIAGLIVVLETMTHFKREYLFISDNGLLEGVWLKAAGLL